MLGTTNILKLNFQWSHKHVIEVKFQSQFLYAEFAKEMFKNKLYNL